MYSKYFLEINSVKYPIEEWNISSATLNINNQSSDEFLFTSDQEIAINSSVNLYRGDTRIFAGTIYKAPEDESAQLIPTKTYQALGPWYELEEIVYQQPWVCLNENDAPNTYFALKSHIVLGQNATGSLINIATQLDDILTYAIEASANIAIGTIGTDNPMIQDETKDISTANAIKRVLKWVPDAVVYFDYSKETPTINILRKSDLETKDIDINIDEVKSYNISPREDLCINGVEIKYEKTHSYDGESWNTLEIDKYPSDFDSQSKKALIMTVELDGYKATSEEREIECVEIKTDSIDWWKEKIPFLRNATNISILELNRTYPVYQYELISGSIPDWAITNAVVKSDEIEVKLECEIGNSYFAEKVITHRLTVTNSASNTFRRTVVSEYEEELPQGLAQSLYNCLHSLKYDATIRLYNAQTDEFVGKTINILNTKTDYSAINSPVMNLSQDILKGTLTIKAGPPNQLYPSNIAEIFRINRDRSSSIMTLSKSTGKATSNYNMSIKDTYPNENTTTGEQIILSLNIGTLENPKKINLDSNEIPDGLTMEVKKVLVAKNGEVAYSYMLMTEPMTQAELDDLEEQNAQNEETELDKDGETSELDEAEVETELDEAESN